MAKVEEIPVGNEIMKFVRRSEWQACDPKNPLEEFGDMPAQYIIMGHCNSTSDSTDIAECCAHMRAMQQFYLHETEFDDIAFNYVVANGGIVYEGRGHQWRAATAKGWNDVAFGVAIMGRYDVNNEHCKAALDAAQLLLRYLREMDPPRLADEFIVYGLRQVRPFDSPVIELYKAIQRWPQWQPYGEEGPSSEEGSSTGATAM